MPLSTPRYIRDAEIRDVTLRYEWDDWKLEDIYESETDKFHERMSSISYRANIAFTIACGEWITYRYDVVSNDPVPHEHMEAAWAGLVDPWYAVWWEPPDEYWLGPIRGALSLAIIFTLEARADAYECLDVAESSDHASSVAEHVMTDPNPFRKWRERVVERLERLYPFDENDPMGDVVPKEALDPDFDFRPEMTEQLVQAYLSGLNSYANRFLRTPEEMLDCGFKGIPYRFDIEADSIARNDY